MRVYISVAKQPWTRQEIAKINQVWCYLYNERAKKKKEERVCVKKKTNEWR